jgi:hypothetical protein
MYHILISFGAQPNVNLSSKVIEQLTFFRRKTGSESSGKVKYLLRSRGLLQSNVMTTTPC